MTRESLRSDVSSLAAGLRAGRFRARDLVERALAAIADPEGEGARTFTVVFAAEARRDADAIDARLSAGHALPLLAGIPISVKDLFDLAGLPTTAGSVVLAGAAPALVDAPVVARLRRAGAVLVGRTNMTEFAYSGLGQNPHFGIPKNPYDRATGRIPGGSSSGAAISVTDGMCAVAIGSDTGGSVRIPAAMTGLVGWKPTADRVPREGMIPLAPTLDSVGPLARSVADVTLVDAVLAGSTSTPPAPIALRGLRLLVPRNHVLAGLDDAVACAFWGAVSRLRAAGALVDEAAVPSLDRLGAIHRRASFGGAESWAWHRALLAAHGDRYDPRVRERIEAGQYVTPRALAALGRARVRWQTDLHRETAGSAALLWPTVAIVAPTISALASDDEFARLNALVLRNTFVVNFLDGCAVSLPCHAPEAAPVGIMIVGRRGEDARVLGIAAAGEGVVAGWAK